MRKSVFRLFLSSLAIYGGQLAAWDDSGIDLYHKPTPELSSTQALPGQAPVLRWRPLEGATDEGDQPYGLPPGTYRRIEERHTITPQLEGYSFRPVNPEEQSRNRSRNEQQRRIERVRELSSGRAPGGANEAYPGAAQPPAFKFRPDQRFDKGSAKAQPRYAFPMGSTVPVFRQR